MTEAARNPPIKSGLTDNLAHAELRLDAYRSTLGYEDFFCCCCFKEQRLSDGAFPSRSEISCGSEEEHYVTHQMRRPFRTKA